jgi:hypothetical protein
MDGFVVAIVLDVEVDVPELPVKPFTVLTLPKFIAKAACARLFVAVIVVDSVNEPIGGFIREKTLHP